MRVDVLVYNVLGTRVRTLLAAGPYADGFRDPGSGSVKWNGRDARDRAVLPGLYYFRVLAIDSAGNSAMSTESPMFLIGLSGLPL